MDQKRQNRQQVTPRFLLEGVVYSLEQCGYLLRHAVALYEQRAYSSAVVLAAFAREELGRSEILRGLHSKAAGGACVTVKDIEEGCQDHIEKQKRGQLSTVQRASDGNGLDKLLRSRLNSDPHSEEYQKADKNLEEATSRQRKRIPEERHSLRMRALYVEPDDAALGWKRPCEISRDEAFCFLLDAANDYGLLYDKIENFPDKLVGPGPASTLKEWTERPRLPEPKRPAFPLPDEAGR